LFSLAAISKQQSIMKIHTWYEPPTQEIEVEIGIEDITRALCQESDSPTAALNLIRAAHASMRAISDEIIQAMPSNHRGLIRKALEEQAARFYCENTESCHGLDKT
jgi:hypothetical protein